MTQPAQKTRSYSFTINNYTDDDIALLKAINYRYIIFGKEVGESGTPHLQGMVVFLNPISFSSMKKKIPRAHLEVTIKQFNSMEYCKKDNDFFEDGIPPKQGQRTDIEEVKDIMKEGGNIRSVIEHATSYQSIKYAEIRLKYFEKPRSHKPRVEWIYGGTGIGKSHYAYEQCKDHDTYTAMSTGRWFEGYDGQTHVIIDDMRKDFMKFHELLRLLDKYEMRVECKGGSRQFVATHIYITSCYHPEDLFETREDIKQLIRRIDNIFSPDNKEQCPSSPRSRNMRKRLQKLLEKDTESLTDEEDSEWESPLYQE